MTSANDAPFRPGARLAGRPLHFVFLLDASGSMAVDGKIEALNQAIRDALPHLRDLGSQNPFVEILVRAVGFSDGARWHIEDPIADARRVVAPGHRGRLHRPRVSALVKVADVLPSRRWRRGRSRRCWSWSPTAAPPTTSRRVSTG